MKKLLIVDDSAMMRTTIEQHLDGYDLEIVGQASDGSEAVALCKKLKPDFVTLDITMPKMDGLECLEQMMAIAPETKVMVITALSSKLTGLKALKKGAKEYLFKPVTPEELKGAFDLLIQNTK